MANVPAFVDIIVRVEDELNSGLDPHFISPINNATFTFARMPPIHPLGQHRWLMNSYVATDSPNKHHYLIDFGRAGGIDSSARGVVRQVTGDSENRYLGLFSTTDTKMTGVIREVLNGLPTSDRVECILTVACFDNTPEGIEKMKAYVGV